MLMVFSFPLQWLRICAVSPSQFAGVFAPLIHRYSFASIDGAEKCIETLRKYRNLHPSFSKVILSVGIIGWHNLTIQVESSQDPRYSIRKCQSGCPCSERAFH